MRFPLRLCLLALQPRSEIDGQLLRAGGALSKDRKFELDLLALVRPFFREDHDTAGHQAITSRRQYVQF